MAFDQWTRYEKWQEVFKKESASTTISPRMLDRMSGLIDALDAGDRRGG